MPVMLDMVGSDYWFGEEGLNEGFKTHLGFYRTQAMNKRWWITDPAGRPFLSMGICSITYQGNVDPHGYAPYNEAVQKRYGDPATWAKFQAKRLRKWGFNTVGSWSDAAMWEQGLAYTVMMYLSGCGQGRAASSQLWLHGDFPDVFSDAFREGAAQTAQELCAPRKDDPDLLGYFSDNELDWEGWRRNLCMFDYFMAKDWETPGKQALVAQLCDRYQADPEAFGKVWDLDRSCFEDVPKLTSLTPGPNADLEAVQADKDAFLRLVARTYFETSAQAIKAVDPHHMYLGVRFAGQANPIVVEECGRYAEIISYNNYSYDPPEEALADVFERTKRPIMITEWSFKAMDSGLPNTKGAAIPVYTQDDRADGYERYVTKALSLPYVVGLHWFTFSDQPMLGRALDGENSNYGVVDTDDEPWVTLVERMRQVNGRAQEIAKAAPQFTFLSFGEALASSRKQ